MRLERDDNGMYTVTGTVDEIKLFIDLLVSDDPIRYKLRKPVDILNTPGV